MDTNYNKWEKFAAEVEDEPVENAGGMPGTIRATRYCPRLNSSSTKIHAILLLRHTVFPAILHISNTGRYLTMNLSARWQGGHGW
jgi:hypothetical protein